jgi:hypothetical protein
LTLLGDGVTDSEVFDERPPVLAKERVFAGRVDDPVPRLDFVDLIDPPVADFRNGRRRTVRGNDPIRDPKVLDRHLPVWCIDLRTFDEAEPAVLVAQIGQDDFDVQRRRLSSVAEVLQSVLEELNLIGRVGT